MGLISKIEDKLSGSGNNDEQQRDRREQQYDPRTGDSSTTNNPLQHPISSTSKSGSGIVGGNHPALTGAGAGAPQGVSGQGVGGAGVSGLSHSGGHSATDYARNDNTMSSNTDRLQNTHIGGSPSTTDRTTPREPYDPYSSKGQQIAANAGSAQYGSGSGYGASNNRAEAGDYGSRRSVDDAGVPRTSQGGVSNQMTSGQGLQSGPHSQLENRNAVPTAGGQKLGTGEQYDSPSRSSDHHYARDAALAGGAGAGAAGLASQHHGREEARSSFPDDRRHEQSRTSHEHPGSHGQGISYMNRPLADQPLQQSSDFAERHPQTTTGGGGYDAKHSQHHYGRDAALTGGAGALGAGAYGASQHAGQQSGIPGEQGSYGHSMGASPTTAAGSGGAGGDGMSIARRVGAAYEAGYRDALEHARAEQAAGRRI